MAIPLTNATRAALHRALPRAFRGLSLASNPFTPNSDYSYFQLDKQTLEDDIVAVPPPPRPQPEQSLYSDIVKPQDTCDLFFKPDINDIVVTSLAKSCAIHGDSLYKVVSKSTVDDSNFIFANIAIRWMNDFKAGIYPLADVSDRKPTLSYTNVAQETLMRKMFNDNVVASAPAMSSFFTQATEQKISLDSATKFLLPRLKSATEYGLLIDHLNSHYLELNPRMSKDLLSLMLDDLASSATLERVEKFEEFFTDKVMLLKPNLLTELDPSTLAQLAYVTTFSSTLSTSSQALSIMVQTHKAAPPKAVYELFMSRYRKFAMKEEYSRETILKDLSPLKSIMHHYGVSLGSFDFLMKYTVEDLRDLSNFVKFAKQTSRDVLSQREKDVMAKLVSLQLKQDISSVLRELQQSQISRLFGST